MAVISLSKIFVYGEEGSSLELKYEYFQDANRVWNHTPAFSFRKVFDRFWAFSFEQEVDVVSGASRRLGLDKVGQFGDRSLDIVSSASKVETRYSENPSITYSRRGLTAATGYYISKENDYFSQSPSGSISWDFNERNTTLGLGYSAFFDDFTPSGGFAGLGGTKRIVDYSATLAQSVTSLTLLGLTGTVVKAHGYLGHPYNPPMDKTGTMLIEVVPNTKQSEALAVQIVQGYRVNDLLGSINIDARRYQDDWAMKSSTVDIKWSQYFSEGFYIRLRTRFYDQTGTAFAKPFYDGNEMYRTADIRWYPFKSLLGGVKASGAFPESWEGSAFLPDRWDIKWEYTVRNTHGDIIGAPADVPRSYRYQLYEAADYYQQSVIMAGLIFNL